MQERPETVAEKKAEPALVAEAAVVATTQNIEVKSLSSALSTSHISISDTLNPAKTSIALDEGPVIKEEEDFTFDDLKRAWKEYALNLKREGRDRIHATLVSNDLDMSSDYVLTLKINSTQKTDLDNEKEGLLRFLREKLRNKNIQFNYEITELKKIEVLDSKASFEKLAEENQSLHKFRKLFHLDIEY